uniref:Ig-like domain-containing protein n=1 Tax=Globodera pallida TaxID=36090 RepID=A0A183CRU0_GLOPA
LPAKIVQIGKSDAEILLKCDIGTQNVSQSAETVQWLYGDILLEDLPVELGGFELLNDGMLWLLDVGSDRYQIGKYQCALNHVLSATRQSRHIEDRHGQGVKAIFSPSAHPFTAQSSASPSRHSNVHHHQHHQHQHHRLSENVYNTPSGSFPRFTYTPRDRRFREGSTVQLNCEAIGEPKPTIIWFFNGRPIEPSRKFELRKAHTELVIYPFLEHDVGTYACEASNLH